MPVVESLATTAPATAASRERTVSTRRVLIVEAAGNLWGSERALLDLLDGLAVLEVAVCCPPGTPLGRELAARGVRVLPYYVADLHRKSRPHRLRASFGIWRACREFRPDVIHLNQSGSYKVVLPAATVFDLPIVAHIRIFEDAEYLARRSPRSKRLRRLIAISAAVEAEIRRHPALDSIPMVRLYDAYAPSAGTRSPEVRTHPRRIACVGRLVPIKGQDVLCGALDRLARAGVDVECLMVGDGDPAFGRSLQAMSAGSPARIRWLGFSNDVVPLVAACSVLVCPSHREPLGRVIFEAWDAGAVPIAFAGSGGAAEIIAASEGGLLYAEQTAEALARTLQTALSLDADDMTRMVANGRDWMARHCDYGRYGSALSSILASAARR